LFKLPQPNEPRLSFGAQAQRVVARIIGQTGQAVDQARHMQRGLYVGTLQFDNFVFQRLGQPVKRSGIGRVNPIPQKAALRRSVRQGKESGNRITWISRDHLHVHRGDVYFQFGTSNHNLVASRFNIRQDEVTHLV
jgi:hypothetical protein